MIWLIVPTLFILANAHHTVLVNPLQVSNPVIQYPVQSQYHAQDELGQYSYGYTSPLSTKNEVRTADGVTRGGYAYLDANGHIQNIQYIADSINGFRVSGTNIPQTPVAPIISNKVDVLPGPPQIYSYPLLPQLHTFFPKVPIALPKGVQGVHFPSTTSQYHSQNSLGQFSYGYVNQINAPSGLNAGGFLYQQQPAFIQGDNLQEVNPSNSAIIAELKAPTETPEVQRARQALEEAHKEARDRLKKLH